LRLRIDTWIDGFLFHGALIPDKVGSNQTKHLVGERYPVENVGARVWHVIISQSILKKINKQLGDTVQVKFRIGDQNYVEITSMVAQYLNRNPEVKKAFEILTPGKKRTLIIPLNSAKNLETFKKHRLIFEELLKIN
jgi:Bacteriocin-protection, YdeI or OmpD-Associated